MKWKFSEHMLFVAATILSAGLHFVYSIYVKAHIEPLEYGMYSSCLLLQTYMAYFQLGTLNAFNRDYPQLIGAEKTEETIKYRNTVLSFLLCIYGIGFIIIAILIGIISRYLTIDSRVSMGLILTLVISIFTIIENYGSYRCRIDKGFQYPSFVIFVELLSLPLGMLLVSRIGYYALYFTSIFAMIIGISLYTKSSFLDFKPLFDKKMLRMILLSGMPLLINGLIWTVVNSIDKFVILGFISMNALGLYGIAQNAFSYMVLIPSAISQLFYVNMGKEYGKNNSIGILLNISIKFSTILAAITSMLALAAYFFLPSLVTFFMPNYVNGIRASQILILGLSVYAATLIYGNILTILKQNKVLLFNSVCMCVFNTVCSIGLILFSGRTIESVALGTAMSYVIFTILIVYQVHRLTKENYLKIMNASMTPVCISLIPGMVSYYYIDNHFMGFMIACFFVIIFYRLFYKRQFL